MQKQSSLMGARACTLVKFLVQGSGVSSLWREIVVVGVVVDVVVA